MAQSKFDKTASKIKGRNPKAILASAIRKAGKGKKLEREAAAGRRKAAQRRKAKK